MWRRWCSRLCRGYVSGGFATKLNRLAIAPPGDSTSLGEDEKVATCEVF